MKSMKKMFALFAVFSMMVTCLSLSSFALEPDTVPSDTTPDADAAMSETDIAADAIEEDALVMPEYDAVLDDVISEIAPEAEIVDSVESDDIVTIIMLRRPLEVLVMCIILLSECMERLRITSTVAPSAVNITTLQNTAGTAKTICKNR